MVEKIDTSTYAIDVLISLPTHLLVASYVTECKSKVRHGFGYNSERKLSKINLIKYQQISR